MTAICKCVVLFTLCSVFVAGCGPDSATDQEQERSAKISAFEDGVVDALSRGVTGAVPNVMKARVNDTVNSCSVSIVDEAENKAKVTATFSGGVTYASGEVERDEEGKWHPDESSGY